jgi:predicted ArsR family transcriptional regulator
MHDRFFDSTRGKIVEALRNRRAASAFELAHEFGLSANAIRQQLLILERDGLVTGKSVRRGKTKPTHEYELTGLADRYFPQSYDRILNAVLREVRAAQGDAAVADIFAKIGKRSADRLAPSGSVEERIAGVAQSVRASGVSADVERRGDTIVLHEHNCPYANVVSENPEACSVIHTMLGSVSPHVVQTESLATGGSECRFEVPVG